jgi:oligopeptide transport system ATP-binding protein
MTNVVVETGDGRPAPAAGTPLIEAVELTKHFPVKRGVLFARDAGAVKAVDGVTFRVRAGKTLGLVGESGCGKTTVARLILRLEQLTAGTLTYRGTSIPGMNASQLRGYRRDVQAVFQDPSSSLNPRARVGDAVGEPALAMGQLRGRPLRERVAELLQTVGLDPAAMHLFPHEFSGGQRQRIAVARALSSQPRLIVLDEPVSALDVSIRAQVLNLLSDLQEEFGLAYLLIAHDLAVVEHMSDEVGVMYLGKIVEFGEPAEIALRPAHPYTKALLSAIPNPDPTRRTAVLPVTGEIPSPLNPPSGCHFHPRCPLAIERCRVEEPTLRQVAAGHDAACHLA